MWAQMITARLRAGRDAELGELLRALADTEQPGSGLIRQLAMRDQDDPSRLCFLVVFESEAVARAREQDPRRDEGLARVRELMDQVLEGPREFVDLEVVTEFVPQR